MNNFYIGKLVSTESNQKSNIVKNLSDVIVVEKKKLMSV